MACSLKIRSATVGFSRAMVPRGANNWKAKAGGRWGAYLILGFQYVEIIILLYLYVRLVFSPQQYLQTCQGLNPGLLHYRQILYCLSHQGSPNMSELLPINCTFWKLVICHICPWKFLQLTFTEHLSSVQFSSVTQSCPTLCDPMNSSTPGIPVHYQLLEFTQTHAHRVGDAIQPSHPLSSPSPPAPNPSQHQDLFQWVYSLHEVAKVLEFQLQHQSFQWTPRTDLLQDGLVGSLCSPRDSQESFPTP